MEIALPIVITALVLVVMIIVIRKAVHQDVPLRWLLMPGGIRGIRPRAGDRPLRRDA